MFTSRYGMKTLSSSRFAPSNAMKKTYKRHSSKNHPAKKRKKHSRSRSPKRSPNMKIKDLEARLRKLEISSSHDSIEMMGSIPKIPSFGEEEKRFVFDSTAASSLGSFRRAPSMSSKRDSIEMFGSFPSIPYRMEEDEGKEERRVIPYATKHSSKTSKSRSAGKYVIPKMVHKKADRKGGMGKRCIECDEPGTRIYCGRKCQLPDGYTRFGTPWECIQKGIYVGKMQR